MRVQVKEGELDTMDTSMAAYRSYGVAPPQTATATATAKVHPQTAESHGAQDRNGHLARKDNDTANDDIAERSEESSTKTKPTGRDAVDTAYNDPQFSGLVAPMAHFNWRNLRGENHREDEMLPNSLALRKLKAAYSDPSLRSCQEPSPPTLLSETAIGERWMYVVVIATNMVKQTRNGSFYMSLYVTDPSMGNPDMMLNVFAKTREGVLEHLRNGVVLYGLFKAVRGNKGVMLSIQVQTKIPNVFFLDTLTAHLETTRDATYVNPSRSLCLPKYSPRDVLAVYVLKEWLNSYRLPRYNSTNPFHSVLANMTPRSEGDRFAISGQVLDVVYPHSRTTGSPFCAALRISDSTQNHNLCSLKTWAESDDRTIKGSVLGNGKSSMKNLRRRHPFLKGSKDEQSVLTVYVHESYALELGNPRSELHQKLRPGSFISMTNVKVYHNPTLMGKSMKKISIVDSLDRRSGGGGYGGEESHSASQIREIEETLGKATTLDKRSTFIANLFRHTASSFKVYTLAEVRAAILAQKTNNYEQVNIEESVMIVGRSMIPTEETDLGPDLEIVPEFDDAYEESNEPLAINNNNNNTHGVVQDDDSVAKRRKYMTSSEHKTRMDIGNMAPLVMRSTLDIKREEQEKQEQQQEEEMKINKDRPTKPQAVTPLDFVQPTSKPPATTETAVKPPVEPVEECKYSPFVVGEEGRQLELSNLDAVLTWPTVPFKFRSRLLLRRVLPLQGDRFVTVIEVKKAAKKNHMGNIKRHDNNQYYYYDFRFAMDFEDPVTKSELRVFCSGVEAERLLNCKAKDENFRYMTFERTIMAFIEATNAALDKGGDAYKGYLVELCLASYRISPGSTPGSAVAANHDVDKGFQIRYHIMDTSLNY